MKSATSGRRMRFIFLSAIALAGFGLGAVFALPATHEDFARVEIGGSSVIAEVVDDEANQERGLAGREALGKSEGMLFLFDAPGRYAIWMKGMRTPIDIFWIRGGVVVDMEEDVPPPEPDTPDSMLSVYESDVPADMILETRAGFARARDIAIGDTARATFRGGALASGTGSVAPVKPVPGEEYFIETMRSSPVRGGNFMVVKTLESNKAYQKSLITYVSGNRTLSGIMNIPVDPAPQGGFPVLILNHGLIKPEIYFPGRGSKREQDFFARHGYVTIHPDYRGYSSASPEFPPHHDFYVGYTEDVLALVDAAKRAAPPYMDTNRIGMWGHSMGGGIASRIAVLSRDINAYVLFGSISADAEDNFYELPADEIDGIHTTYGLPGDTVYKKMSPLSFFHHVEAPVQLHHGVKDYDVPIVFSEKMFETLRRLGGQVEFFSYSDEGHEFADAWPLAASRALQFFDKYVKNTL